MNGTAVCEPNAVIQATASGAVSFHQRASIEASIAVDTIDTRFGH